jgi:hypothetical protein
MSKRSLTHRSKMYLFLFVKQMLATSQQSVSAISNQNSTLSIKKFLNIKKLYIQLRVKLCGTIFTAKYFLAVLLVISFMPKP